MDEDIWDLFYEETNRKVKKKDVVGYCTYIDEVGHGLFHKSSYPETYWIFTKDSVYSFDDEDSMGEEISSVISFKYSDIEDVKKDIDAEKVTIYLSKPISGSLGSVFGQQLKGSGKIKVDVQTYGDEKEWYRFIRDILEFYDKL